MKKRSIYLLSAAFMAMGLLNTVNAQQGTSCSNAIQLTDNQSLTKQPIDATEKWYYFRPTTRVEHITVVSSTDTTKMHIHSIHIYDGCSPLKHLNADVVTSITDGTLDLTLFALIPGHNYQVQLLSGDSTCNRCGINSNDLYDLSLTSLPSETVSSCTGGCSDPCPSELLFNGGFEQGNVGFGSDATYHDCTPITSMPPPFFYGICTNASNMNTNGWTGTPHSGNLAMWVDDPQTAPPGNTVSLNAAGWANTTPIKVKPGTWYCISFWTCNASVYALTQPEVVLSVDGNNTFDQFNVATSGVLGSTDHTWHKVCYAWYSDINTELKLWIGSIPPSDNGSGNDYGLDDISVQGVAEAPSISATASTSCTNYPATLSAVTQIQNATFYWQPGGQTTQSITVNPSVTTTYTLTVSNPAPNVCQTESVTYTITPVSPIAQFVFSPDENPCIGTTINFTNQSSLFNQTSTYSWNFGDNTTASGFNASHAYSAPGTYLVTLTITNSCGTSSYTQVVNITPSSSTYNTDCSCTSSHSYTYDEFTNGHIQIQSPISSPAVWSGVNYSIRGTLYISPGAELDITNNSTVEFEPYSKIVVLPGGILKVDHSTLTGLQSCGTMWQGVEVAGDKTKTQTQVQNSLTGELYQGKVILNYATISLAHNGVVLGRRNSYGNLYDQNYGGGIILATHSTFKDCGMGVRFTPYSYVNNSRITECSFSCTSLPDPGYLNSNSYTYPNSANPLYAYANASQRTYGEVQTFGVKFVLIADNAFDNAEYGIIGINSSLRVIAGVNGPGNTFTNITNGEVHGNIFTSPFYANRIDKNNYSAQNTPVLVPIQVWSGIGDRITNNNIYSAFVGVGAVSSGALFVNDNNFGSSSGSCLVGISTSNTGTMGGLIGHTNTGNIFTNCVNGAWLSGNNSYLQVHCNQHLNGTNYQRNWGNFGPLANQGTLPILTDKDPAGNRFFPTAPSALNQIYSSVLFDYHSHNYDNVASTSTDVVPTPSTISGNIFASGNVFQEPFALTATSCDPFAPCTNCTMRLSEMDSQISGLQAEKDSVLNLLDGGQTAYLLSSINSNMSGSQLEDLLLNNSPLSDEVLLAFIARNGTPPANFTNVVIANSPVSISVRPALYEAIEGMNEQADIIAAQSGSSNRTLSVIGNELESLIGERQQVYNQQQTYYLDQLETDSTMIDSVYALLIRENTFVAKAALASSYMDQADYTSAASVIAALDPKSDEQVSEVELLTLLNSVYGSGRDVYQLDSTEEGQIRTIAGMQNDCQARASARVLLFVAFGEPLELELDLGTERLSHQPNVIQPEPKASFLGETYPNPATDEVSMKCNISEGTTAILRIFDMNGKLIYSQEVTSDKHIVTINTKSWKGGVYMCSLDAEGKQIGLQKLVIVKNDK